jgi:hypothetical protein
MLRRMGWRDGEGLGVRGDGRRDPIEASSKRAGDTAGLGFQGQPRSKRGKGKGTAQAESKGATAPRGKSPPSGDRFGGTSEATFTSMYDAAPLKRGVQVRVGGLKTTHGLGLNGRLGCVQRFDTTTGRYAVLLDPGAQSGAEATTVALRPTALTQQLTAVLTGLESRADLNGSECEVISFAPDRGRYTVRVGDRRSRGNSNSRGGGGGTTMAVKPDNVVPPVGVTVVLTTGSASTRSAELDGQFAQVVSVDATAARVVVVGPGGKQLRLRLCQVRM